jgi:microcystin degradation protein MlrC
MRILVGGISQESNTFAPTRTTMEQMRSQNFYIGENMRDIQLENEIGGFFKAAREEDVEFIPVLFMQTLPSGIFAAADFAELKQLLLFQLQQAMGTAEPIDGIYFAMHGAMVAEGCDDVEGELTAIIRAEVGDVLPFVISLDPHANVTKRMVAQVSALVGYKTFPHVDFLETGYTAAKLLFSIVGGEVAPKMVMRKIPMIVPAENSRTSEGPFADLWTEAARGVQRGDSIVTSLFPVQPWIDVEELGFAVVVVSTDAQKAEQEADRLSDLAWNKRHEFDVEQVRVAQIVAQAQQAKADGLGVVGEPFIISDSADSPGAGSSGDSNAVLQQLLELNAQEQLNCLLSIVDAPAVEKAIASGIGATVEVSIGYTVNTTQGKPLAVRGRVSTIGDGKFHLSGGSVKDTEANMGRCVVLEIDRISLIVCEKATYSGDPGMYRSLGLEPSAADIVLVRSAAQFRADYEQISSRIFILDTPGTSPANLKSLTFRKIARPFFPFDDDFEWAAAKESI